MSMKEEKTALRKAIWAELAKLSPAEMAESDEALFTEIEEKVKALISEMDAGEEIGSDDDEFDLREFDEE